MIPRAYRRLGAVALLLLAARVEEALFNIEPASGFFRQPRAVWHLILLAAALLGWAAASRLSRGLSAPPSDALRPGGPCFILCASAGAVTVYGGFMKLSEIIRLHPFHHFFMNREQLAAIGYDNGWFRLEFVWAVFSFAAAAWYIAAAVSVLRTGNLHTGRLVALAPVLWYVLRAVSLHFSQPINRNNSVAVSAMLSLLALGWVWYSLARYFSLPESPELLCKTAGRAFGALCFSVSFALPGVVPLTARGAYADAILLVADALAALAAAQLTGRILQTAKETKNVQQQVD